MRSQAWCFNEIIQWSYLTMDLRFFLFQLVEDLETLYVCRSTCVVTTWHWIGRVLKTGMVFFFSNNISMINRYYIR